MAEKNGVPVSEKNLVLSTVIGLLIIFLTFLTLYRAERINNRAWQVKSADKIDPANPGTKSGMVKFTGTPEGNLIEEPITGKKFIYLDKTVYTFKKVKKTKSEFSTGSDKTKLDTRTIYENDWAREKNEILKAETITVGVLSIRLNEAELMGKNLWSKTVVITRMKGSQRPMVGDKKYVLSGIHADSPIFATGVLNGSYLESGKIFIVSSYSEGKTIEKLHGTSWFGWLSDFFYFIFLFTGFVIISHPLMRLMDRMKEYPVFKSAAKMGWSSFIPISLILAFLIVKFSPVLVELIWVIIAVIIIVPTVSIYKKIKTGKSS